jgi:hypothetical protein
MAIDWSVAAETVNTVVPLFPPDVAVIVVVPALSDVARPVVGSIVAVLIVPLVQVTPVSVAVEPSE